MSIIEVGNLSFAYSQSQVLRELSFNVEQGSFLAVIGPNGAGKSTLLNLLCGALHSKHGSIKIDQAAINSYTAEQLARKIAVVRQEFVPVFGFSVIETVLMARTPYYNQLGFQSSADTEIANEALAATDTSRFSLRLLSQLSGGERQRVFIARALAQNTDILLLDEPTSFLDLKHQVDIYDLLKKMQIEKGKTIVTVTHDINLAAQYCDQVLLLGDNCSYRHGSAKDIFCAEQIEKVFGVRIFAGAIGEGKFFVPLGKFAKNSRIIAQNPEITQNKKT